MMPKLSNDLQQAVQRNHGFAEAEADGAKFVVMSMDFYRDMMGVGSDEALQDSLRAINEGIADVQGGRSKSAARFFAEFDEQHGLSQCARREMTATETDPDKTLAILERNHRSTDNTTFAENEESP